MYWMYPKKVDKYGKIGDKRKKEGASTYPEKTNQSSTQKNSRKLSYRCINREKPMLKSRRNTAYPRPPCPTG
jgi:hypothetical protein